MDQNRIFVEFFYMFFAEKGIESNCLLYYTFRLNT